MSFPVKVSLQPSLVLPGCSPQHVLKGKFGVRWAGLPRGQRDHSLSVKPDGSQRYLFPHPGA